jgi:lipopolysaccharide/colanic/teichoic acid biosynthesis glycosyltransferase
VLFKQTRGGLNGRPFTLYKFRSMRKGAEGERDLFLHLNEQSGPIFKIAEDPRLTPIGRFLRRSSLDELPQLLHCVMGQMSLVGPRPLWISETKVAGRVAEMRLRVKPGVTGLWQVCGRSELEFDELLDLDFYYIRRRSTLLDLMILVQTVPAVLTARGAY